VKPVFSVILSILGTILMIIGAGLALWILGEIPKGMGWAPAAGVVMVGAGIGCFLWSHKIEDQKGH
jgi:hypothetical protein